MVESLQEEIKRLCTVLQRLCDAGLKLSPKAHSPSAIRSFSWPCGEQSWPIYRPQEDRGCTYLALSTNSERCRKLPGLCSYYRHFGFADIARPLYRLTEGQREFRWTSECEDAFHWLKTLLTTAPNCWWPVHLRYRCKQHSPWHSTLPSPRGRREGNWLILVYYLHILLSFLTFITSTSGLFVFATENGCRSSQTCFANLNLWVSASKIKMRWNA